MDQLPQFALVRWVEEDNLSAVSTSSVRPGQTVYIGAFGDFKWKTKYYEAEVLSLSGEELLVYPHFLSYT